MAPQRRRAGGVQPAVPVSAQFSFHDRRPDVGSFLDDVLRGLALPRKSLPPKYFYDEAGCELFEAICELPEYYLTRTETAMMEAHASAMAQRLGPRCALIEYGSGTSRKSRILIAALDPAAYVPIDIAAEQLRVSAAAIARAFQGLPVHAVCADYSRPFALPALAEAEVHRKVIYFPGSTIGNLTRPEALAFLRGARTVAGRGGAMLVGVDLRKSPAILVPAYEDAQGVTARFNLNLLVRINRELQGDFDISAFRHEARYDEARGRIEMHLVSTREQQARVAGRVFDFRVGESIHTENSCKYSVAEFEELARDSGFVAEQCWTDAESLFSVHLLAIPD